MLKLQCDLLTPDRRTLSVRKALTLMWEHRNEHNIVGEIIDVICKFADEKKVFEDLEFYLPQIAHWIVHMHNDSANPMDELSRFALILSQTSMHTALQLSFLLQAYLEDYQPETSNGLPNANCDAILFHRCAKILQDVERAVIYGCSDLSTNEIEKYKTNCSLKESDFKELKKAELAGSLAKSLSDDFDGISNGFLLYKRSERKSSFHTKSWKKRYFVVNQRMINCYRDPYDLCPIRAVHLQHCEVVLCDDNAKYGSTCFIVSSELYATKYLLRAESEAERTKWVNILRREIAGVPPAVFPGDTTIAASSAVSEGQRAKGQSIARDKSKLTQTQRIRYYHFLQAQIFVKNLTNICERLRFKERPLRQLFLRADLEVLCIPPLSYLPLRGSTEPMCVVRRCVHSEAHAFNTKARCPSLMLFEVELHPTGNDVASFLEMEMDKYDESEIVRPDIHIVNQHAGTTVVGSEKTSNGEMDGTELLSAFRQEIAHSKIWSAEGTGLERLRETPPTQLEVITQPLSANLGTSKHIISTAASITLSPNPPAPEIDASVLPPHPPATSDSLFTDSQTVPRQETSDSSPPSVGNNTFQEKANKIRDQSTLGHLPGWQLDGLIAKSNDDLRQEVFVMQLLVIFQNAFKDANLPVWLHTYKILSTSKSTGLIELIKDASSLDALKKKPDYPGSLKLYFEQTFTSNSESSGRPSLQQALDNYVASLAGYSVVTYLLGIKDRHNGNIMIDKEGHIIHIDFGFVFGLAPGKAFSMEKAPFKLNKEMADVIGGPKSPLFASYTTRCVQAFKVARTHASFISTLLEMTAHRSCFPAFKYNPHAVKHFKQKLHLDVPEHDIDAVVHKLITRSYNHNGSDFYDSFQLATNGIAK